MRNLYITTGTVTYAIKGRDLLRRQGYDVRIERKSTGLGSTGCGYNIVVRGNTAGAVEALKSAGVKILAVNEI